MKIRSGFVSNSSTSSFCLIGFEVAGSENEIFEKLFKDLPEVAEILRLRDKPYKKRACSHSETHHKYCGECGQPMWIETDVEEIIEKKLCSLRWKVLQKANIEIEETDWGTVVGTKPVSDWEYETKADIDLLGLVEKMNEIRRKLNLGEKSVSFFAGTDAC
jgi:hypothetical protein